MSIEANKQLARDLHQTVLVEHNFEALGRFVADSFIDHTEPTEQGTLGSYAQALMPYFTAFPDFASQIDDVTSENDLVVTRLTYTGTQQGEFHGRARELETRFRLRYPDLPHRGRQSRRTLGLD